MPQINPKQLRKVSTGQIFNFNPALARRKDMVPHWPDGVDPNGGAKMSGLNVEQIRQDQLMQAVEERDQLLQKAGVVMAEKDNQIKDLTEQLTKANAQVNDLRDQLNAMAAPQSDPVEPGKATNKDLEGVTETPIGGKASRQELINDAVSAMFADGNKADFTTTGLPRIENIEARCQIAEITAAERDAAVDAHKKTQE